MQARITVSDALGEDFRAAYAVHKGAFNPESPDFLSVKGFKTLAESENSALLCAKDPDSRVLGYVLFRWVGEEGELLSIAVAKPHRGKGFGEKLAGAALERLKTAGCRALFLEVEAGNRPAIGLYERLGGTAVGRRKGYYTAPDGQKMDAVVFKITWR